MKKIDIFRTANLLLTNNGDRAVEFAVQRMTELQEDGEYKGAQVWFEIMLAIGEIKNTTSESAIH